MNLASVKSSLSTFTLPRVIVVTIIAVGGLALFLFFASSLLISTPITATFRGYFYGVENSENVDSFIPPVNQTAKIDAHHDSTVNADKNTAPFGPISNTTATCSLQSPSESTSLPPSNPQSDISRNSSCSESNNPQTPPSNLQLELLTNSSCLVTNAQSPCNPQISTNSSSPPLDKKEKEGIDQLSAPSDSHTDDVAREALPALASSSNNETKASQIDSGSLLFSLQPLTEHVCSN